MGLNCAIPSANVSGLNWDANMYPTSPKLINSLLLASGNTNTGFSKATEVTHNAATYKICSIIVVPWWVSPRSTVKFACETKSTAASGRVDFMSINNRGALSTIVTPGGTEFVQAGWNEANAGYTAHNVDLAVTPGSLWAVLLKAVAANTMYMQNAVVTYDITGADLSIHTGWLGGL